MPPPAAGCREPPASPHAARPLVPSRPAAAIRRLRVADATPRAVRSPAATARRAAGGRRLENAAAAECQRSLMPRAHRRSPAPVGAYGLHIALPLAYFPEAA